MVLPAGSHLVKVVEATGKESENGSAIWEIVLADPSGVRIRDCLLWNDGDQIRFKRAVVALGIDLTANPEQELWPKDLIGRECEAEIEQYDGSHRIRSYKPLTDASAWRLRLAALRPSG